MLIEFRVQNFRSLRDENILSMVANNDKTLKETNVITSGIPSLPGILRTAGIYGANASGKSNFVRAMVVMRTIVLQSAVLAPGQPFNVVQPFMLDPEQRSRPTEFEVTFKVNDVRYQFGFAVTATRITREWLIAYKTQRPQNWYTREYNEISGEDDYKFGPHFQGQRQIWQASTRPNALFLSIAIQLNNEQLKPVFEWFATGLTVVENGGFPIYQGLSPLDLTLAQVQKSESTREAVTEFLSDADIGISKIEITKEKGYQQAISFDASGNIAATRQEAEIPVPIFWHSASKGEAQFRLGDESEGTQRLFMLAGPLFEMLRTGCVLFVDELDRSLHAHLVHQLVRIFQNPASNPNGAQLIFTTHDTSLLHADLLRRDQFWFVEKDADQASAIFPLTEFSPRKNEALERAYLSGRYGAVPILKNHR